MKRCPKVNENDHMSEKEKIRSNAKKHRKSIVPTSADYDSLKDNFFGDFYAEEGSVLAGYYPVGNELDVMEILEEAVRHKVPCCLPVQQGKEEPLRFARWTPEAEMEVGPFDIPQPVLTAENDIEPDVVLVPLLAFDRKGHRIGYGAGHYDRTLAALKEKKSVTAIGIGFAEQAVLFDLPADEYDQSMDYILTPQKLQKIG